jgi:hypothetical protein
MLRAGILSIILCVFTATGWAQIRVGTLLIKAKEKYEVLQSDILVADTLIMMDSSVLVLNKLKRENFVRVRVAIFGKGCVIDGSGINGQPGRNGKSGSTPSGPCDNGTAGRNASSGLAGTPGINLFLYLERITLKGPVTINLSGGNGGNGGNGGDGGSGSPGTVHCIGGNGANGGNAGAGGDGADGGTLTISSTKIPAIKDWIGEKIIVKAQGGQAGRAGKAGYHGSAGLGPSRKNGKNGNPGTESTSGIAGTYGKINFESN